MTTFHPAYRDSAPRPYAGTRDELVGGEYLGPTTRYEIMRPGDIVVSVTGGPTGHVYYYDPKLRIAGDHHWVKASPGWREVKPA